MLAQIEYASLRGVAVCTLCVLECLVGRELLPPGCHATCRCFVIARSAVDATRAVRSVRRAFRNVLARPNRFKLLPGTSCVSQDSVQTDIHIVPPSLRIGVAHAAGW